MSEITNQADPLAITKKRVKAWGACKAGAGGAIVIVNRDDSGALRHIFASKVGENGIEADVWYVLDDEGVPQKIEEDES